MSDQPIIIAYYVVAATSIASSVIVGLCVLSFGSLKTVVTKLMVLLHVTLLVEEITVLPYIYDDYNDVCTMMAFLHFFSGLSNAVCLAMLVISYRYLFFPDTHRINAMINKYGVYTIALFPCITFLPFSTNTYEDRNKGWCTIDTTETDTNTWAFSVFFGWVWLFLLFSIFMLTVTTYQVFRIDSAMGMKLLNTVGFYGFITIFAWLPRTAIRIQNFHEYDSSQKFQLIAFFPLYISGLLYALLFFTEKKSLQLFEKSTFRDGIGRLSFSWEEFEEHSGSGSFSRSSDLSGNTLSLNLVVSPMNRETSLNSADAFSYA